MIKGKCCFYKFIILKVFQIQDRLFCYFVEKWHIFGFIFHTFVSFALNGIV